MCLNTLTKKYARPSRKVVKAWKIVERGYDGHTIKTPFQDTVVTKGWMAAEKPDYTLRTEGFHLGNTGDPYSDRLPYCERETYPWGFHVFATKADADKALAQLSTQRNRFVIAVEITNIVAEGTDGTSMSRHYPRSFNYVARSMRILDEAVLGE